MPKWRVPSLIASSFRVILVNRNRSIHSREPHYRGARTELNALVIVIKLFMCAFTTGALEGRITARLHQHSRDIVIWHLQAEGTVCRFGVETFPIPGRPSQPHCDRSVLCPQMNIAAVACVADWSIHDVGIDLPRRVPNRE